MNEVQSLASALESDGIQALCGVFWEKDSTKGRASPSCHFKTLPWTTPDLVHIIQLSVLKEETEECMAQQSCWDPVDLP
eukprot:1156272-Pelagomonas_calceolata.AAC.16